VPVQVLAMTRMRRIIDPLSPFRHRVQALLFGTIAPRALKPMCHKGFLGADDGARTHDLNLGKIAPTVHPVR